MQGSTRPRLRRGVWRVAPIALAMTAGMLSLASPAFADDPLGGASPSSAGMPGAALVRKILGWMSWLGLAACAASIIYGAATWAGFGSASSGRAVHGKTYVLAGAVGALIVGLVPTLVRTLFAAGGS